MSESPTRFMANGRWVTEESGLLDRGLQFGDGVFRTLTIHQQQVVDAHGQLQHLLADAQALGMTGTGDLPGLLEQEIAQMAAGIEAAALKIILTRGNSQRGYAIPAIIRPNRYLCLGPPPANIARHGTDGICVMQCQFRWGAQPGLGGIKHLNRLPQVMSRREWQNADAQEGLVLDQQGQLISATQSNIFMVQDGRLLTPDISDCGIRGRTRERILALAAACDIRTAIRPCTLQDLQGSDEVFVCNSLIGIWPVVQLGEKNWRIGPITRKLQANLQHPVLS